jgi:hypothetical protein
MPHAILARKCIGKTVGLSGQGHGLVSIIDHTEEGPAYVLAIQGLDMYMTMAPRRDIMQPRIASVASQEGRRFMSTTLLLARASPLPPIPREGVHRGNKR